MKWPPVVVGCTFRVLQLVPLRKLFLDLSQGLQEQAQDSITFPKNKIRNENENDAFSQQKFGALILLARTSERSLVIPVNQVPLENSVESHWKFSEIPLETSENLLETS